METKACAIIGHRPTRFKWKYSENNTGCKRLKKRMCDQFVLLYEQGVRRFYVGGTLGVDMWAAEILLRLKEKSEYNGIELIEVLPFDGYAKSWDKRSQLRMDFIIRHSAKTIVMRTTGQSTLVNYQKRNTYMVDHANYLLAVYDDNPSIRSGTGLTVNYAKQNGLSIILIHPDTAIVTCQ